MERCIGWAVVLLASVAASAGCAPKAASGSSVDSPAEIVDISITPDHAQIVPGASVALVAVAHMSDGSDFPVTADWSLDLAGIATLSKTTGATIAVDGVALGVVHVTASNSGRATSATIAVVEWTPPVLKGSVFGIKAGKEGMVQYDSAGVPAYVPTGTNPAWGLAVTADASRVHLIGKVEGFTNAVIGTYNPAVPGVALMQAEIPEALAFYGLDVASNGKVVCQAFGAGSVYWYDPATGSVTSAGKLKIAMQISLALTPAGKIVTAPMILQGGGIPWIRRQVPDAVAASRIATDWAYTPVDIETNVGYITAPGLVFDDAGDGYFINYEGHVVYRAVDLDGNGDVLDDGEVLPFATIPAVIPAGKGGICGLANAGGRRGLLVNAMRVDGVIEPTLGIYFVADLNHDGDADDEGEVTLFSSASIPNDQDTGCVGGSR